MFPEAGCTRESRCIGCNVSPQYFSPSESVNPASVYLPLPSSQHLSVSLMICCTVCLHTCLCLAFSLLLLPDGWTGVTRLLFVLQRNPVCAADAECHRNLSGHQAASQDGRYSLGKCHGNRRDGPQVLSLQCQHLSAPTVD